MALTMLRKFRVIENNQLLIDPFPGVIFAINGGKAFAFSSFVYSTAYPDGAPLLLRQPFGDVRVTSRAA
jgi:hypothetical protein